MHCLDRRSFGRRSLARHSAVALLPALLLLFAGCTQNSGSQFHSYEAPTPHPEGKTAEKATEKPAAAPSTTSNVALTSPDKTASRDPAPATTEKKTPGIPAPSVASTPTKTPGSVPAPSTPPATTAAAKIPQRGAPSAPRKTQLLVPNKTFRTEGESLRVSYDDIDLLKVLNMDPVTPDAQNYMPAWLKALDGRRIRIRGFMYPTFQQTGVHAFGLARDNQICCFGRNPKIYDVFDVVLREGTTTNYIPNRPFDVVGVFHIRPEAEDGKLYRLYEMDDASVISK